MQGRASPRLTRRWLVLGGGGALAGGALAACDGGIGGQTPAANKPPVRLLFMSWRPIAMDQFAPAWKEYEQQHNATIEIDPSGDGNQEKITTMFAAETGPDLFDSNTRSRDCHGNSLAGRRGRVVGLCGAPTLSPLQAASLPW